MTMEKLSEAVLSKVKAESADIIREAEETAREKIEKAREQYNIRLEEEKVRLREEVEAEASRIQAQASLNVRQEILKVKNEVIRKIVSGLKKRLAESSDKDRIAVNLIKEGIESIGKDEVIVYVSPGDSDSVKDIIKKDKELSSKIKEIREKDCIGGAVIEDTEGRFSIDNTYETRLESLLPKILPEISKELFGS